MTFEILNNSGTYVDIYPYIATGGLSWRRGYVEGGNNMTMQDGTTVLDRIAEKGAWSLSFKPLTAAEQALILSLLPAGPVTARCTDPESNSVTVAQFYAGEITSAYLVKRSSGIEYWGGMTTTMRAR